MEKKSLAANVAVYTEQLEKGAIREAYAGLMKYVMSLKAHFANSFSASYAVGNLSPGYMDYTYFPFFNAFLRERKLRFGIVLNHPKARFELWLMGQNAGVQRAYWDVLKSSGWSKHQKTMPKYSVVEVVLVENPDFSRLESLTQEIEREAARYSAEIIDFLR